MGVRKRIVPRSVGVLFATLTLAASPSPGRAAFVTSAGSFHPQSTVIDFSQFTGGFQLNTGAVQVGGLIGESVIWEPNSPVSVIGDDDGDDAYGLSLNGFWDSGRAGFVGTNSDDDAVRMTFRFHAGPVSQVGGFVNYVPDLHPGVHFFLEALDGNGNVLESYDVRNLAPLSFTADTANAGGFRGIVRTQNDIAAFRLFGSYAVLDDLTFYRANAVPAPAGAILFGIGLAGLGAFRALRRRPDAATAA